MHLPALAVAMIISALYFGIAFVFGAAVLRRNFFKDPQRIWNKPIALVTGEDLTYLQHRCTYEEIQELIGAVRNVSVGEWPPNLTVRDVLNSHFIRSR